MAGPGSNFWVTQQPFNGASGGTTYGGGADAITYRSTLDAERSMAGRDSQYPDGYLGTITDRHQDKLMQALQKRLQERSYQRGVHVGSKIGQEQYYWPNTFNPQSRLAAQSQAVPEGNTLNVVRSTPSGDPIEYLAHMGKWDAVDPAASPVVLQDPDRTARMRKMLPTWSGVTQSG